MAKNPSPKRYSRALRRLIQKETNSINHTVGLQFEKDGLVKIIGKGLFGNWVVELTQKGVETANQCMEEGLLDCKYGNPYRDKINS